MTTALMLHADALVNAIAVAGLVCALVAVPQGPKASPLDKRLATLYVGLLIFLALRQAFWAFGLAWLVPPIMSAGAWLPLLVLLLVEELLRRHAPRALKWLTLAGGAGFTVAAFALGRRWPVEPLIAFAAFLALALLAVVFFIVRERRHDLTAAETRMADSVALALLLCVPLTLTEFRSLTPELPVTLGYMGILLFTVMTSALASGIGSPLRFGFDMLGLAVAGVVVAACARWLIPTLSLPDLVRLCVVVISVNAVILMVSRLNQARLLGRRRKSITATLAALSDPAGEDAMIGAHPVTAGGRIVNEAGLALYGADTLAALAAHRVLSRASRVDGDTASAVQNLLDEYGATHLVRLSPSPLRLLALASGSIGGADPIEAELALLSRLVEGTRPC